jgi:hypothetical protein
MNQASKSAHSAASPGTKPGVSEVLGILSKLATHANSVPRSKSRYKVVLAAFDPAAALRAAFRIQRRPTLGEGYRHG